MKKKVMIGMSGGVDSSVAAYLLKEQGYDVIGVTMKLWQDDEEYELIENDGGCCSLEAVEDARSVAQKLDIPFYVLNFKEVFKEKVIDYFIDEYINGRTPNPCIACNKYIKFEDLYRRARQIGCDYVATGHYARIEKDEETGRYLLTKSVTDKKDQTYALYNMTQDQLEHTLLPIGDFEKEKVREMAKEEGAEVFVICAQIEQELSELDEDEKKEYLEDLGVESSGLDKLVAASYSLLGLISFLTAGEDECRAWTIKKGTKAPQAAGKIHTDFERGFIKAEVVNYQDLLDNGSLSAAREKGIVGMEGKDYVVKDGDVILFRFNV